MDNKKKNIVITSAARTAIGTYRGSLKNVQAYELGSVVVKEVMEKSNLNSNDVDELIMGQVLTGSAGQNPARQAAIKAGLPINKTAYIINQVCGSGLRSVASAYQAIMSNDSSIIIAGGQESMTNAPHAINFRNGKKLNEENLIDTMIKDGLWDAFNNYHMGITAENVAS
jgi:acetyl-CoA C-acetyltransferase